MLPDLDVTDPADLDAYLADLKLVDLHAYQAILDDLAAAAFLVRRRRQLPSVQAPRLLYAIRAFGNSTLTPVSRGLGRVERAILAALAEVPGARMSTKTLVAKVFGTAQAAPFTPHGATKTQVASVARAVRSLARKGLVATSPSNAVHRRRQVRAV